MKRRSLFFDGHSQVELRQEELAAPGPRELQVGSNCSAISAGTELLIYRGEVPSDLQRDDNLPALQGKMDYPFKYGYSMVGEVGEIGGELSQDWRGKRIFAFNPHEDYFNVAAEDIQIVPEEIETKDAVFLANMETALNLVLQGNPRLGERAVVLGQGVLGLLTSALLARHPLGYLATVDDHAKRRELSKQWGAEASYPPGESPTSAAHFADLVFELSGQPQALNEAIRLAGPHGRVVVGSWYGLRTAELDLGRDFHRKQIQLISSHVSAIPPELRGRWNRERRFEQAWRMLADLKPSRLISHHFNFADAPRAYQLLDKGSEDALAVVFDY